MKKLAHKKANFAKFDATVGVAYKRTSTLKKADQQIPLEQWYLLNRH